MFGKQVLTKVPLAKGLWEPLRKLSDVYGLEPGVLAECWGLSETAMLRVLYAARLAHLEEGDEVSWFEELGDGNADAVSTGS